MNDLEWLQILCCPETRQSVSQATKETLSRINRDVAQGQVKNRSGQLVKDPLDGLLVREDGKYGYPIRNGIPVMLVDEGLSLQAEIGAVS